MRLDACGRGKPLRLPPRILRSPRLLPQPRARMTTSVRSLQLLHPPQRRRAMPLRPPTEQQHQLSAPPPSHLLWPRQRLPHPLQTEMTTPGPSTLALWPRPPPTPDRPVPVPPRPIRRHRPSRMPPRARLEAICWRMVRVGKATRPRPPRPLPLRTTGTTLHLRVMTAGERRLRTISGERLPPPMRLHLRPLPVRGAGIATALLLLKRLRPGTVPPRLPPQPRRARRPRRAEAAPPRLRRVHGAPHIMSSTPTIG